MVSSISVSKGLLVELLTGFLMSPLTGLLVVLPMGLMSLADVEVTNWMGGVRGLQGPVSLKA